MRPFDRLAIAGLLPLVLGGCVEKSRDPEPSFTPTLVASSDAVVWQGLAHTWLYNHRWGRLGSGFVRTHPDMVTDAYPLHPEPWEGEIPGDREVWTYMGSAGAGTGKDLGDHRAFGVRLSDAGVQFASITAHHRIKGPEGSIVEVGDWTVSAPLPATFTETGAVEVVLNGFWLQAVNEEAKQPFRFSLDVGPARVEAGIFSADVAVALGGDCDTPECAGCFTDGTSKVSNTLEYDLYVDLLVIAGPAEGFAASRFVGPQTSASWDGPSAYGEEGSCLQDGSRADCLTYWVECGDLALVDYDEMPDDVGRETLSEQVAGGLPVTTIGLTGFDLALDEPHHMLGFDVSATDVSWTPGNTTLTFQQSVRFKNWAQGMNIAGQDADVLSLTSFGTSGSYTGIARWTALGFAEATVARQDVEHLMITEASQLVILDLDEE